MGASKNEGFAANEALSKEDDIDSAEGDADEKDQIEVAGRMFRAAKLQIPLAGELEMPIGKMRWALRGMWMEAIPRVYGIDSERKGPAESLSGRGFEGGPGPVGKPKGGSTKDKKDGKADGNEQEGEVQGSARDDVGTRERKRLGTATATGRFWATC